jgi:small conductance mechanosensitive channel
MYKKLCRKQMALVFWVVCLVLLPMLWAVNAASAAEITDLAEIRAMFDKVQTLKANLDSVHDWQKDGFIRHIDHLAIQAIDRLNTIAPEMLTVPAVDQRKREELIALLDEAVELALGRDDILDQRVAAERKLVPKFKQSPEADIARAFMEGLVLFRERYLTGLAEQAAIRQAAGLASEALLETIRERVLPIVNALSGQIRLDAMTLDELRSRLAGAPLDEDLKVAIQLVQAKQSGNLDRLERILDAENRLGLDITDEWSLLVRERGEVNIGLLHRKVFAHLWEEEWQQLRESFARNGPNLLLRTFLLVIILLLAAIIAKLIRIPLRALLSRDSVKLSMLLRDIVVSVSSVVLLLAGLIIALTAIGVSLGHLFAGLGVIGIIIGLAVQDSLRNLAAGVMILIYRPYDMDDHIKLGNEDGFVKRMNLLATTISTLDNQSVIIPNGRIWGETIINFTANRIRRVDIKTSVAYAEDLDRVEAVLLDLLDGLDYVLRKPEPAVHVCGMEDSAVGIVVKSWVRTEDYLPAYWDLNRKIKQRLDAEGIEIPFPQRVVTMVSREHGLNGGNSDTDPAAAK